ncbi:hypothetical protein B0J12DRAFT_572893 [Macrophomina phaseolina]|uniref:Flavin-containing monooxygenase-like protein n=1 Tax=Macrophomina phaseolina TaxID=35725 RepID=A0ABQ8GBS9_9PEZI|nr:hypothetical protein B0J12DRAFT_572893 [Macrophomina phaseolina]
MAEVESRDLVIVGAGFHGLAMARTYLKLNPDVNMLILDAGTSIGGVWAADRLYPFLRTISQWGHFEYSDFPMTGYGVKPGEHMRGDVIRQYLEDYAQFFDLTRRTRLNSIVREAEDLGADGWLLSVSTKDNNDAAAYQIHASKLVVAIGLTSTPSMPSFPGQESFNAPLFHSREFGPYSSKTLQPGTRVAVLSGNKSACDVVYAHAASGASVVHWIIRSSGHGPCWMAPPRTSRQILVEKLITTRVNTWLNPCIWGPSDGFGYVRQVINQTQWGQRMIRENAQAGQAGVERHNAYDTHPELAKLRPWNDVFWIGTGRGLLNYERNILDFVREGRVKVHIADIDNLSDHTVQLSNGEQLSIDALICCTGWKHETSIAFTRGGRSIAAEMGLPHPYDPLYDDAKASLIARADSEILSALPRLRDQPPPVSCPPHLAAQAHRTSNPPPKHRGDNPATLPPPQSLAHAYVLYRFMLPPSHLRHRTIAFTGATRTASTALIAQLQALWLCAYFAHRLPHLEPTAQHTLDRAAYEAVLHARYGRWRYPLGFGAVIPDFLFDALPYFDLLLKELGLRRWRKGRGGVLGWSPWREVFESYGPPDYRGLTEEWARKEGIDGEGTRRSAAVWVRVVGGAVVVGGLAVGAWVGAGRPSWEEVREGVVGLVG